MRKHLRFVSLILCLTMTLTCAMAGTAAAQSTLEPVHLVGYVPGDPSSSDDEMMAVLNAKLTEDINATIEFKYLNWGEFFDKYPLILASGEQFDFAYIASWNDFTGYAAKGAFLDITDMLEANCPDIMRLADPAVWQATSYHGRVYGIPHDGHDISTSSGFVYREDLRKKYDCPELKTLADLEVYMKAIHENEPNMETFNMDAVNNNLILRYAEFQETGWDFDTYGIVCDREDPDAKLLLKYETETYKKLIETMARWREMGFWDASVLTVNTFANQVDQHPFGQGMNAFFGTGTGDYKNAYTFMKDYNLDWEAGFFWTQSPSGHIEKGDVLNDGVSVSVTSKNPERTLMAMNLLLTDKEYQYLLAYGVEGDHYVLDENGTAVYPEGISADNAPYTYFMQPFSWFIYDTAHTMPKTGEDTPSDILEREMDACSNASVIFGFNFDTAGLETEIAALSDIWTQYEIPLTWGFINESVEADIANLVAMQKAAGIDRVMEEAQRQIDLFLGK